jgi:hypothetical protein
MSEVPRDYMFMKYCASTQFMGVPSQTDLSATKSFFFKKKKISALSFLGAMLWFCIIHHQAWVVEQTSYFIRYENKS